MKHAIVLEWFEAFATDESPHPMTALKNCPLTASQWKVPTRVLRLTAVLFNQK